MKKSVIQQIWEISSILQTTDNINYKMTWESIYRSIPNLQMIISAAATKSYIETKVTPIWEQIREKKKLFLINNYWDMYTSLNVFDEWLTP